MEGAILIVFHMDGCPHCKAVTGSESACRPLQGVRVLEIEASHPAVEDLRIQSFPTIWLSLPRDAYAYTTGRPRATGALQDWIDSKIAKEEVPSPALFSFW